MTCYEVRHSPLIQDQGLFHWVVNGEWGHGMCHRWCRWGTLDPLLQLSPVPPCDHSGVARAPMMLQFPLVQIITFSIGDIMRELAILSGETDRRDCLIAFFFQNVTLFNRRHLAVTYK